MQVSDDLAGRRHPFIDSLCQEEGQGEGDTTSTPFLLRAQRKPMLTPECYMLLQWAGAYPYGRNLYRYPYRRDVSPNRRES